jgi:hypothetical protein
VPDNTAPTTTIAVNGQAPSAGWYNTPVTVGLTATDNAGGSGVDKIYYTTNGSTPTTASTVYTAPFTVSATATVKFFATDKAGNAEQVKSQLVQVDSTAPTTQITCNGLSCGGTLAAPVQVGLSATDNAGGSGVNATFYTTDGSDPKTSSTALLYSGPFNLSQTTTVRYYSTDTAGNSETAGSQQIQIDATAPTTQIACNGTACISGWYKAAVTVTLSAADGGSGVSKTYYTTNGSTPTTSSTVYAGPFQVSSTSTVKFFSVDNTGNAEVVKSQAVQVDTAAPTTTIRCNGAACTTGWYRTTPVSVTLSATDTGGSGVKTTVYTTDGSNPQTSTTAVAYSGPFSVSRTTTVKYYSADLAGNSESVKTQQIQVDAAAPTVSITAPSSGSSFTRGTRVTVTASAADLGTGSGTPSGVANVTFRLDGTTVLNTDTSSPYSFSWNTSNVTRGQHTLTAVATDAAGNSTTSAAITVTIR